MPFCAPVGYATHIGENCGPMQEYSTEQIEQVGIQVARNIDKRVTAKGRKFIYFPASLAQLPDLPATVAQSLNQLDIHQSN